MELKQVEGREREREREEEINIISRPGLTVEAEWWWLVVTVQLHSLYGQQLLYQAIANHHLAAGSMAVTAPVKLTLDCLATQYITRRGKRKLLFCWSDSCYVL